MEKKRDVNRKKNRRDFYVLDAATIRSYIWLELENPYFEFGGRILMQKDGLPMGGLCFSLAIIDSISQMGMKLGLQTKMVTWLEAKDAMTTDEMAMLHSNCEWNKAA